MSRAYTKHGHARRGNLSPEYKIWHGMVQRCTNPNVRIYKYYGGRGITVCKRWRSFSNFLADMGTRPSPKHTIHRKHGNRPYSPGNCVWATMKEQNRQRSNSVVFTIKGETMCLSAWAEKSGVKRSTINSRLGRGWSPLRAIFLKP